MLNEIKDRANDKMQKALNNLNESLGGLRAGRANPHILDKVTVDYYGAATAINQLASVAVPEARMITIQPYDSTWIFAFEKAIFMSDLASIHLTMAKSFV